MGILLKEILIGFMCRWCKKCDCILCTKIYLMKVYISGFISQQAQAL